MSARLRKKVAALTEEYGGEYTLQHAQRLIRLVETIADGDPNDQDAIWLAAHMHDWGALPRWSRPGMSHSRRSRDLADEKLRKFKCPPATAARVLEAIEYHHGGADDRCIEPSSSSTPTPSTALAQWASSASSPPSPARPPAATPSRSAGDSAARTTGPSSASRTTGHAPPRQAEATRPRKAPRMKTLLDALAYESFGCL